MDVLLMVLAFLQETAVDAVEIVENGSIWDQVLAVILPVLVGWLTLQVMKGVKWASNLVYEVLPSRLGGLVKIDGFPATVQRALVLLIAAGLTWVGGAIGVALPTDLAMLGEADVSAGLMSVLSMVIAMAFHAGDKARTTGG
jgi:hypothetical protein